MSSSSFSCVIRIVRILKHCTIQQSKKLIPQIVHCFVENEQMQIFALLFTQGIFFYHSKVKQNILDQINKVVVLQKIKITSNINPNINTDENADNSVNDKPKTFLQITHMHRLKIHLFQYLSKCDLYILSQTSRALCIEIIKTQSKTLIQLFINVFIDHEQIKLLENILIKGICCFHHKIKQNVFRQINLILPNIKELIINDTITLSELIVNDENQMGDDEQTKTALAFLQIPSDLKIYIFQYLREWELYSLEKTCRSIYIDAIDPNSITSIMIEDILHINKYTQNIRYSRIKYLYIAFVYSLSAKNTDFPILPMVHSFNKLHTVEIRSNSFSQTKTKFDKFLTLFYEILSKGRDDKILILTGFEWDTTCSTPISVIFDNNCNKMAKPAIFNVKKLYVNDWENKRIILENIFAAIPDTITDNHIININDVNNHYFDCVEIEFEVIQLDVFKIDWNWQLFKKIVRTCKCSKLKLRAHFFDYSYFVEWIDILINNQFFTEFTFEIIRWFEEMDILSENAFEFIQNDIKLWYKINEHVMKQIGMKHFKVTHEYHIFDEEPHEREENEIRAEWNGIMIQLRPKLDQWCVNNNSIAFNVYQDHENIFLNLSYQKQL